MKYPYATDGTSTYQPYPYATPYLVYPPHQGQQFHYQYPSYPSQQAEPQGIAPLVYPTQVNYAAPNDPRDQGTSNTQKSEQEPESTVTAEDEAFLDSVEHKDDPNMPLTPLPAPLAPEVLPSAKKAAVMQNFGLDGEFETQPVCLSLFCLCVTVIVSSNFFSPYLSGKIVCFLSYS